jgi:hypothetical protein
MWNSNCVAPLRRDKHVELELCGPLKSKGRREAMPLRPLSPSQVSPHAEGSC